MKLETHQYKSTHAGHVLYFTGLFLFGLLFGYGVGMQFERAELAENQPLDTIVVSKSTSTSSNSKSVTMTYTSSSFGFSFNYPSAWNDVQLKQMSDSKAIATLSLGVKGANDYEWGIVVYANTTVDDIALSLQNGDPSVTTYTTESVNKFGTTGKKVMIKNVSTGDVIERYVMQSLRNANDVYLFDGLIIAGNAPLDNAGQIRVDRIKTTLDTLSFFK